MARAERISRRRLLVCTGGLVAGSRTLTVELAARQVERPATVLLGNRQGVLVLVDPDSGTLAGIDVAAPTRVLATPVDGVVIVEDDAGRQWLVRLADGHVWPRSVEVLSAALARADVVHQVLEPPRWSVRRTSAGGDIRIVVRDAGTDRLVFDETFKGRIELAASAVSPDGRFTIYVQGNNVASEVTVLDADAGTRRVILLRHDADLAAFAIAIAFGPSARAAVSMERADGRLPQTWMLDLAAGVATREVDAGLVLAWMPLNVERSGVYEGFDRVR